MQGMLSRTDWPDDVAALGARFAVNADGGWAAGGFWEQADSAKSPRQRIRLMEIAGFLGGGLMVMVRERFRRES
jgi:hypothetical protein